MTKRVKYRFDPVEVRIGRFLVRWILDPDSDRDEVPYLAFQCMMLDPEGAPSWWPLPYGEYVTALPATTEVDHLLLAARRLVDLLRTQWTKDWLPTAEEALIYRNSIMLMSHISPENFTPPPAAVDWPREALGGAVEVVSLDSRKVLDYE